MIKNPDRNYDREASVRVNPDYDPRKPTASELNVQKLIAAFQLTYLGAPMLYYGDEAGMWGGDDPDDRKPMVWPDIVYEPETYTTVRPDLQQEDIVEFNRELYQYYQTLIRIRHDHSALREGDFRAILIDDENRLYAFVREHDEDVVAVAFNAGEKAQQLTLKTKKVRFGNGSHNVKQSLKMAR